MLRSGNLSSVNKSKADCPSVNERDTERGRGMRGSNVFFCFVFYRLRGQKRMLDRELIELMKQKGGREPHSRSFVCFAAGTARCLSVCLLPCFSNHLESFQASAISPNKATRLFSLSHQQLSLSRIRSIGPKLLCYRHLTEAKQEKQRSCCPFYVTPTAPDCRTVSAAYGYVQSENIPPPMLFLICRVSPFCSEC